VGVCIKLSLPLLVSCVFFGLVYFRMQSVTTATYQSSMVTTLMGGRTVSVVVVAVFRVRPVGPSRGVCQLALSLLSGLKLMRSLVGVVVLRLSFGTCACGCWRRF
jgi:hypothetical protein